jgi:predicted helicase
LLTNFSQIDDFNLLNPIANNFFFTIRAILGKEEYENGRSVVAIFRHYSSGIQTKRDNVAIAMSKEKLLNTIKDFSLMSAEDVRSEYALPPDGRDWKIQWASSHASEIIKNKKGIEPILYRPFDVRWTIIDNRSKGFVAYPRFEIMSQMLHANLGLIVTRQLSLPTFQHGFVSRNVIDGNTISLQTREYNYLFPLYYYPTARERTLGATERIPNFSVEFIKEFSNKLGLELIYGGEIGVIKQDTDTLTPEDIFAYAYAIFHSPTYRARYAEFLKIDFPRLPLTSNTELFRRLCAKGGDLVALHLLEDDYAAASWQQSPLAKPMAHFVGADKDVAKGFPKYEAEKVSINRSSYFDGVPESVWNFHIGGYQVANKWLKDRRERTLSAEDITHYTRVITALHETIRLMSEIDEVIEEHGGFPLVGSQERPPNVEQGQSSLPFA